jgi:spore coat polysaccharide biosynthesis protein SpsF
MGSTRLPGKMLLKIGNEKLIDIIIKRLLKSYSNENIILATSKNKENADLVNAVNAFNIETFQGSENNVLSRFIEIANIHKVKYIVRITGDSPCIEPSIIEKGLLQIESNNYDYVSTTLDSTYPVGIHIEIFRSRLIEDVDQNILSYKSIEHVTPFIYNDGSLKKSLIKSNINYPPGRYTIDYHEDIEFFRKLVEETGVSLSMIRSHHLNKIYRQNNELFSINNMILKERTVKE